MRAFKLSPANLEARRLLADALRAAPGLGGRRRPARDARSRGARRTPTLIVLYAEALTRVNHAREAGGAAREAAGARPERAAGEPRPRPRATSRRGSSRRGPRRSTAASAPTSPRTGSSWPGSLLQELAAAAPEDDRVLQRIIEVAQKRGDAAGAAARTT